MSEMTGFPISPPHRKQTWLRSLRTPSLSLSNWGREKFSRREALLGVCGVMSVIAACGGRGLGASVAAYGGRGLGTSGEGASIRFLFSVGGRVEGQVSTSHSLAVSC